MQKEVYGKIIIIGEPFSINGRKHCNVKCSWCGKEFQTEYKLVKKGRGCSCKTDYSKLINKRFKKLTIIRFIGRDKVECRCDCGNIKIFNKYNVLKGSTFSCGCQKHQYLLKKNTKHNKCGTRIYHIYLAMKGRCFNNKSRAYKWYGDKGITICNEWLGENGFENFYNWAMQNGYKECLSIERIDINQNYEPSNCKWIPLSKQSLNTSKSIKIESENNVITVAEFSKKHNIPKSTLYSRIRKLGKKILKEEEIIGSVNLL